MPHPDEARFNEHAATWDSDDDHVQRATTIADAVRAAVPLDRGWSAIEIGGGTGLLARALADDLGRVDVTDVASGMVEAAAAVLADPRYPGWRAVRYDIEHDPLPAERYDLVLSQLALHHMGDVAAVIGTVFALLAPGGWVALADLDADPDGAFHSHVENFTGHHGIHRGNVEIWLETAGFVDVRLTTAGEVRKPVDGVERTFPIFLATGRRPV